MGLLEFREYQIGGHLDWGRKGERVPSQRPPGGSMRGEGYVECPRCGKDYWVEIVVEGDVIVGWVIDSARPGYLK